MPDSAVSVCTAEADGASPTMRQPFFSASARARFSIRVLPVPANPCTPTVRSFSDRISFTACFCPAVSGPLRRCRSTVQSFIGALPRPAPLRINAIVSRSSATALSVVSPPLPACPGPDPGNAGASCNRPSRWRSFTARSISPIEAAPGL